VNEAQARDLLYARSERVCERCGMRRATNAHHRRAPGRVWSPENLLDLCGTGTTGCHGFVTCEEVALSREFGWVVRRDWDPLWIPVLQFRRWVFLTRDGLVVPLRSAAGLPELARAFP
jgi:hypothetical protein